jgi:hypothetical protein
LDDFSSGDNSKTGGIMLSDEISRQINKETLTRSRRKHKRKRDRKKVFLLVENLLTIHLRSDLLLLLLSSLSSPTQVDVSAKAAPPPVTTR